MRPIPAPRESRLISVLELMLAVVQRAVDVEEALTGRVQRLDERVTMLAREGGASQPPPLQRT